MTDIQVLKIAVGLLKVLDKKSQRTVGELLGYTNESSFSQILNGKVPIPNGIFEKLSALNPDVKNFILNSKKINASTIETNEGPATTLNNYKPKNTDLIPYYDAGFMAGKSDAFYDDDARHPDYYMDIPEFYGCTAFRAFGDSMENIIKSSSILFGVKLDDDWKESLEYGQIYGITMKNGLRYLKYIRRYKEDPKNFFLLESENQKYDEFEIKKDKIKNIWLIQGWMDKRA